MTTMRIDTIRQELIYLSHQLGMEERELAILGEGNTSADCGDGTFWVKASGSQLHNIDATGFSRVRMAPVLEMLQAEGLSDREIAKGLQGARVDDDVRPSVETFLHALCLAEGDARWVAHTHPTPVNQILCSKLGAEPFLRHIFPDAIVVCGLKPAVVSYVDPGLKLAHAVREELTHYRTKNRVSPKMLLLVNHGLVALGQSPEEVLNITLMADKWARVLLGTYALGGPAFLPNHEAARIDHRPDELYRRGRLVAGEKQKQGSEKLE